MAAVGLSFLLPLPQHGKIAGMPSPCAFFELTGWPCPACGLTRAFVCCAHGRWAEAQVWHPLGPILFLSAIAYILFSLSFPKFSLPWSRHKLIFGGLAVVMLGTWVLRLAGVWPLPT